MSTEQDVISSTGQGSIGQIIKSRRVERGLSLSQAHEATKITMQNLAAIEEDRFDAFPNRVYARAFLRDYANFLGLDSSALLERYEQDWSLPVAPPPKPSRWKAVFGTALALIVLAGLGGAAYYYSTLPPAKKAEPKTDSPMVSAPKPTREPAPKPAPVDVPAPAPKPSAGADDGAVVAPTSSDAPVKPTTPPPTPPAPAVQKGVTVKLKVVGSPVWVSIKTDGKSAIQKTLESGHTATFTGNKTVSVLAGNAGGLDVTVNGKHIGVLGKSGQVVTRKFTADP